MRWTGLLGLSVLASSLVSLGCETAPHQVIARAPELPGADLQARAQKPEVIQTKASATVRLLDLPPDRSSDALKGLPAARIRAVVNDQAILDEEVKAAGYQAMQAARSEAEQAEIETQALNQLIDREVVLQDAIARLTRGGNNKFLDKLKEAANKEFERSWLRQMMKANHMKSEEEFKTFLRDHQMSFEMIRRQWERNFMAMEYMRSRIDPNLQRIGHAQIVDYYDKHPEEFQVADSVQWQDIFIAAQRHASREAARRFAEVLANRIRTGEDFVKLAAQFDDGDSSLRNGDGIGRNRGEIKPHEAEALLFQLRDGEVGPVIELDSGFHIIRLVKREHAGPMPFDEKVQKQIKDKLRGEVFTREMKRIVNELKRKAIIEIAQK